MSGGERQVCVAREAQTYQGQRGSGDKTPGRVRFGGRVAGQLRTFSERRTPRPGNRGVSRLAVETASLQLISSPAGFRANALIRLPFWLIPSPSRGRAATASPLPSSSGGRGP